MSLKSTGLPIICDECRQPITSHDDAYVEWIEPTFNEPQDVRIVHAAHSSPNKPNGNCFKHTAHFHRCDMDLSAIKSDPNEMTRLGLI